MHSINPGYAVVVILFICIAGWYWWLMPLEREMARKLFASEMQHLWTNVKSAGAWVKQKYEDYRAKKSA